MNRFAQSLVLGASAIFVAAIGIASFASFTPLLIWNASASAPIGLYSIQIHDPKIWDFVLVEPDEPLVKFISDRGYLPPDVPLLKRVSALPGDEICRENEAVFINKTHVAEALLIDSLGRKMPEWSGCFSLNSDEVFLLNAPERSLDGRYFGATKRSEIVGIATPIWIRADAEH